MEIKITSCKNGAYAIFDDGENEERFAYRFDEDNLNGLTEMLWDIKENFEAGDRYSQFRVVVSVEHGDKYECSGCDICGIKKGDLK